MNIKMLIYILGKVLLIEGILMVLPIVIAQPVRDWNDWKTVEGYGL